jgi:hypothetical protein
MMTMAYHDDRRRYLCADCDPRPRGAISRKRIWLRHCPTLEEESKPATAPLLEAFEMIERGFVTEQDFREFTFTNAAMLHMPSFEKSRISRC